MRRDVAVLAGWLRWGWFPVTGDHPARGLADGLYAVVQPKWVAGFVVEDGQVTMCPPILRRKLAQWMHLARRVEPTPAALPSS